MIEIAFFALVTVLVIYGIIRQIHGLLRRHGEPWGRDLVGDNLVLALVQRIWELEEKLDGKGSQRTETPNEIGRQRDVQTA